MPRKAPVRRPHRSNSALSIVRGIKTLKTIYWTTSRLRKLLPGVFSSAREEHFAKAVAVLRTWPERTREQILEDASRINPRRLMNGRWAWPKDWDAFLREYADRAPEDGVDTGKLREALRGMDYRTRERFMELVTEELKNDAPRRRDGKIDWRLFRRIARAHSWLMDAVRRDPDPNIREIDISQKPIIPGGWEIRHWKGDL